MKNTISFKNFLQGHILRATFSGLAYFIAQRLFKQNPLLADLDMSLLKKHLNWVFLIFLTFSPFLRTDQNAAFLPPIQSYPVSNKTDTGVETTRALPPSTGDVVGSDIVIDPAVIELLQGNSQAGDISLLLEFVDRSYLETATHVIAHLAPSDLVRQFPLSTRISLRISTTHLKQVWTEVYNLPGLVGISIDQETIPLWMDASRQINLDPTVWNVQGYKGDPYSSVAVIDHGLDPTQACFAGKNVSWVDFAPTNWPVANDTVGHGTMVGAVAVGNGWNYTDNQGRTIMSRVTPHTFPESTGIVAGKTYYYVEFSVNVSRPGTLNLTGYWVASDGCINMKNFSFCDPSGAIVATVPTDNQGDNYTLEYIVNDSSLGVYTVITKFLINTFPVNYNVSLELRIPQRISENGYNFQGVAPNCRLVALRATTNLEVEWALDWIKVNFRTYNITSVVLSFTLAVADLTIIRLINELVGQGVIVVAAAGNSGPGANYAGYGNWVESVGDRIPGPASADKAITVGAVTQTNRVTSYSSQGGTSYYNSLLANGFAIKPDVLAPGGEFPYNGSSVHPLILPDANTAEDAETEKIFNDTSEAIGTSFSAPAVAGLAQLIIEALGGTRNWTFSESQALLVKSLISMTATETNLPRINSTTNESQASPYSPSLDRGDKDVQEGYGRINPAGAIQAITTSFDFDGPSPSAYLWGQNSGPMNATRCWATRVFLNQSYMYNFTLINPGTGDFDLYVYQTVPTSTGDPIIYRRSTNSEIGFDEIIPDFAIPASGMYYIVIKAVRGEGTWTLYANKTLDMVRPVYCWLSSPPSAPYLSRSVSFSVTAIDGQTGIHYQELWKGNSGAEQLLATAVGNGTITWNTISFPDGHYLVNARVYDGNNNSRNSENSLDLIVDNSPPSRAQFVNLQKYGKYGGSVRIWIDATDALSGVATCALMDTHVGVIGTVPVVGESPYLFVWQTNVSIDNMYQLSIVVQDRAGNQVQSAAYTIYVANNEIFMFGLYYFALLIGPVIIIGYILTRFILYHEGLTRAWSFAKKVRMATEARDWERLSARIKKPVRSRQKRNN